MTILNTLQNYLGEHVGRADLRLFEAILECAPSNLDASKPILSLDKDQVLNSLREIEGKDVSAEVVRSRIRNLNVALTVIGRDFYNIEEAILTVRSQKDSIVLELPPPAVRLAERDNMKRALAKAAKQDNVIDEGDAVESRFALPITYQVMISHGWEDKEVEKILDNFVEKLDQKLSNLPRYFRDQFSVRVWFDRKDMNARAEFKQQTDVACKQSKFAVFMTSDRWCASQPCQREYKHFKHRNFPEGARPFILIQLSGNPEDLGAEFTGHPCFPHHWDRNFTTLLELWEKGDEADKDNFTTRVRKEICDHLEKFGGLRNDPEPTGQKQPAADPRLRDIYSAGTSIRRDIPEEKAIETRFISDDKKPDERTVTEDSTPALPYLRKWAKDKEARNRIFAILGGFGMGKTVTVQRFADELYRDSKAPTPIYLDFRRLISASNVGQPIRIELPDIILQAISPAPRNISTPGS